MEDLKKLTLEELERDVLEYDIVPYGEAKIKNAEEFCAYKREIRRRQGAPEPQPLTDDDIRALGDYVW